MLKCFVSFLKMNRRSLITTTLAASAASALGADSPVRRRRMGLVIHSYSQRWQGRHSSLKHPPFHTPLDVLDHVRGIGVGSLQITVKGWNNAMAGQVRDTRESYGLNLEGSITLPLNEGDTGRFEQELRLGKEAGATIFRSATEPPLRDFFDAGGLQGAPGACVEKPAPCRAAGTATWRAHRSGKSQRLPRRRAGGKPH